MNIGIWVLVILLVIGIFSTQRSVRRSRSEAERYFAIRVSAFCWVLGFAFLVALIFLPNRPRILLMLPLFFTVVGLGKLWRNGRARLRSAEQTVDPLERAKPLN